MKKNRLNIFKFETHPFGDFLHVDTKTLIVGTFPTHKKNRDFEFYYAGRENHFWDIIETVFEVKFQFLKAESAINERKTFLMKNQIGMTDMLSECYRKDNQSGDEYLYPVKFNDLITLLERYPNIKSLVFTSRTDAIGALGLFKTHLHLIGNDTAVDLENVHGLLQGIISIDSRNIDLFVPYSPSDRAVKEYGLDKLHMMYGYALNNWVI